MTVADWGTAVTSSLQDILTRFINFIPLIVGAVIILIIGWIVGIVLGTLVDRALRVIGLQTLFDRARVDELVKKSGSKLDTSALVGAIVKWIIFLVAFVAAADTLRLPAISEFLSGILSYVPSVVSAAAIILIGAILANFLANVAKGAVLAANLGFGDTVAAITKYSVLVFAFLAALAQLQVATTLIQPLFTGFVALLAIAGGLAFGLGGQGVAREFVEKLRDNLKS